MKEALTFARTEAARCRKAVANGSPVSFWEKRLVDSIKDLEAAALILRMQIAAFPKKDKKNK